MKTIQHQRIFLLIWIVLSLSALQSIYTLVKGIALFHSNQLLFWATLVKLVITAVLIVMSLTLFNVLKAYFSVHEWKAEYYLKVRQMGYWAIVLTLLNSLFQLGYEVMWNQVSHSTYSYTTVDWVRRYYAILLMESPAIWVLTLSIFLFAELLRAAHQVKAENESFI